MYATRAGRRPGQPLIWFFVGCSRSASSLFLPWPEEDHTHAPLYLLETE
jgi:hypothetical protein